MNTAWAATIQRQLASRIRNLAPNRRFCGCTSYSLCSHQEDVDALIKAAPTLLYKFNDRLETRDYPRRSVCASLDYHCCYEFDIVVDGATREPWLVAVCPACGECTPLYIMQMSALDDPSRGRQTVQSIPEMTLAHDICREWERMRTES